MKQKRNVINMGVNLNWIDVEKENWKLKQSLALIGAVKTEHYFQFLKQKQLFKFLWPSF